MSGAPRPIDGELPRLLAHLNGTLTREEALRLERALGRDPALAAVYEELAEVDHELRATLGGGERPGPLPAWSLHAAWAVVAALLLGLLGAGWWLRGVTPDHGPLIAQVAVVGTAPSAAGLNELLGFAPDWLPASMGEPAPTGTERPAPDAYARKVRSAFAERVRRTLAGAPAAESPRSFVVALRPRLDCHVLLLVASAGRAPELLLPLADPEHPRVPFEAGRVHLLPAAPVGLPADWRRTLRVELRPGLLARPGLRVTLALSRRPPGPELLAELRARIQALTPDDLQGLDALEAWLVARAFQLEHLAPAGG